MDIDELKEKATYYESFLFNWFLLLLVGALVLMFFKLDKLCNIALCLSLSVLVAQKIIRILDICHLMKPEDYFIRLILVAYNLTVLGSCLYVFYYLFTIHGKNLIFNFDILKALEDLYKHL